MSAQPQFYDPNSSNEQAPPLPSAPLTRISPICDLQPPLTRRGTGPGLILMLPIDYEKSTRTDPPLDPHPVQKWAEEGFTVVSVRLEFIPPANMQRSLTEAFEVLKQQPTLEADSKIGIIVYEDDMISALIDGCRFTNQVSCIVAYCPPPAKHHPSIPTYIHSSASHVPPTSPLSSSPKEENLHPETTTIVHYPNTLSEFVFPDSATYDAAAANLAHTRTLTFLRKHLGGPHFDIEAIWEEHTYWEFERRSVAQTMATMVAEPYVNHVPTMTGGIGREKLQAFYRDHFIFCNPPDTALNTISRTVGPDRIVDEFIFTCTHTTHIPWLLPSIPPTNKPLSIPMIAVVNVRGDRLYHEHIWWDQATTLRQAGLLPTHVPASGEVGGLVRLPVAGAECARLLADETDGVSNEMIDPEWAKN